MQRVLVSWPNTKVLIILICRAAVCAKANKDSEFRFNGVTNGCAHVEVAGASLSVRLNEIHQTVSINTGLISLKVGAQSIFRVSDRGGKKTVSWTVSRP